MQPKTFRASNTQAALELVQNELGPEAMILSVKQVPGGAVWETWKKSEVEVQAIPAYQFPEQSSTVSANQKPGDKPGKLIHSLYNPPTANKQPLARTEIQGYLEQIATQISQNKNHQSAELSNPAPTQSVTGKYDVPAALVQARLELLSQGVDPELVKNILKRVSQTTNPKIFSQESRLREVIRKQLETVLRVLRIESAQNGAVPTARVLIIVGSSGVGKTSLCARLASHFMATQPKKIAWICADTIRTGAIAQTKAYTESLNLQPHIVYTPADLKGVIEYEEKADLIVVDTPARNPYEPEEVVELSTFLTEIPKKITLLALPATLKLTDMQQALAAFSPLKIEGIAITKMDETRQYGHIVNLAWKNKIPLAYFCDGTNLLESLHPAEASHLVNLILP